MSNTATTTETVNPNFEQFKLEPITKAELLNHDEKNFNEKEWIKIVESFAKMQGCRFFIQPKDKAKHRPYNRFFAVYLVEEGFSILNQVSYSSSLSNAGFKKVTIDDEGNGCISYFGENKAVAANCKENRLLFAKHGLTVTTEYI